MKTKRNEYHYNALNSALGTIRLLTVLPAPDGATQLSLHDVLLDDVIGQYDAISYVWGNPTPHRHLVVDGKELQVRDNIYQCLKHLRRHWMISKPLWIDCICINQADSTEKEQQIAQMSNIFSSASTVYAWLGRTSLLFQPDQNPGHAMLRSALHDSLRGPLLEDIVRQHEDPIAFAAIDQLMRLVYDEYWHRLWIVQEMALAPNPRLVMGEMLINAKDLEPAYLAIRDASKPLYYTWLRRQNDADFRDHGTGVLDAHPMLLMRSRSNEMTDTGLAELIERYRKKLCVDPRDRVYGLLGLTTSRHCPPIDYKCSVETLLLRTIDCLIAEVEHADPQETDDIDLKLLRSSSWTVACLMQSLDTTAARVQSAIATSLSLGQGYARRFEAVLESFETILPCVRAPSDKMTLEGRCTSIQTPLGRVNHFWKCCAWFGPHNGRRFQVNETGTPWLVCSIGRQPALILSINTSRQVRIERLICFDVSRNILETVQYKSRHVPPELGKVLNAQLNTLDIDWQSAFAGKFFNTRLSLSRLELVELAETWDLRATDYNPRDRDVDWRMTYEVRGNGPDVDDLMQILRDSFPKKS